MKIKVRMLAFYSTEEKVVRVVDVPDDEFQEAEGDVQAVLNLAFKWGQNDFQSLECCSVSVGDIIEYQGHWRVAPVGFQELTDDQVAEYEKVEYIDRMFWRPN